MTDVHLASEWINLDTLERDQPDAIKIDQEGNVIVAGQSYGSINDQTLNNGLGDGYISKSRPDGTIIWQKLIGTEYEERITGVAVDKNGNVYVSGITTGSLFDNHKGGKDIFIAKFNTHGETEWGIQAAETTMRGI